MTIETKNEKEKNAKILNEIYKKLDILSEKDAREGTVTFRLTIDEAEKLTKEIIAKTEGKDTGVITITKDGQVGEEKFEKEMELENKSEVNIEDEEVTMTFSFDNAEKLAKEIMKNLNFFWSEQFFENGFVEIISSNDLSGVTVRVRQADVDRMCIIDYHNLSYLMMIPPEEETTRCFIIKYLCREEIIYFFEENECFPDMKKIEKVVMSLSDDEVYDLAQGLADCLLESQDWDDLTFDQVCMWVVKEKLGEKEAKKMEFLRNDYTVIDKNFDDMIKSLDKERSEEFHESYSKSDKMICLYCNSTFLLEEVRLWFLNHYCDVSPTCAQCYSKDVKIVKNVSLQQ